MILLVSDGFGSEKRHAEMRSIGQAKPWVVVLGRDCIETSFLLDFLPMDNLELLVLADRIEGEMLVFECVGYTFALPLAMLGDLPVAEGAAFRLSLVPAPEEGAALRERVNARLNDLASRDDGGDLSL